MRERIFEPFFRMPGHAEQAGGVGLGLALVKQIAERHGGSVRCEARDGRRQPLRDRAARGLTPSAPGGVVRAGRTAARDRGDGPGAA